MVSLCQVVSGNSGIRSRKGQKQEENYDHSKDIFYKREPILVDQNQRTDQYQNHDGQCPQDKYPQEGQAVGRNIKDHPVSTGEAIIRQVQAQIKESRACRSQCFVNSRLHKRTRRILNRHTNKSWKYPSLAYSA